MSFVHCEKCRYSFEAIQHNESLPACRQCGGPTVPVERTGSQPPARESGKTLKLGVIPGPDDAEKP